MSAEIDTPIGQKPMAGSVAVVIASNQSAIPVSGTIATGGLTDTQLRATPVPVNGTVAVSNMIPAVETGLAKDGTDITTPTTMPAGGVGLRGWISAIWTKLNGTIAVTGTFFQATQPVSAASLPLPAGAATATSQTDGNQKVSNYDLQSGQSVEIDTLRRLQVSIPERIFGDSFADGIGSGEDVGVFPVPTLTGAGTYTASAAAGQLVLSNGAANGSAILNSNTVNFFKTGSVSATQVGLAIPSGFTAFSVVARKASVDTVVASGAFNGTAPAVLTDATATFHQYQLRYLGNSCIFISDGVKMHSMSGQVTTPRTGTLDFPLRAEVVDSGGVTTIRVGSFTAADGYFFRATYTTAVFSLAIRGFTALRLGVSANKFGSVTSANNTTMVPLAANATFTGLADNVLPYVATTINMSGAGPVNALGTLYFEYSPNGVNWDVSVPIAIPDVNNGMIPMPLRTVLPFFRVRYVNGGFVQTAFRLTVLHHYFVPETLTRFLSQGLTDAEPIKVGRSVIAGQYVNATGTYDNALITARKTLLAEPPALATAQSNIISVGLAAVQLDVVPLPNRVAVEILYPASTAHVTGSTVDGIIYVGWNSAVTATTFSREISPGESFRVDVGAGVTIFCIANWAAQRVCISEFSP